MDRGLKIVIGNPEAATTNQYLKQAFIRGNDRIRKRLRIQLSDPVLRVLRKLLPLRLRFEDERESAASHILNVEPFHTYQFIKSG